MSISRRENKSEEDAYLAAIVESSDDAIIGWALDGSILSWNHGAEKIYGYSAAEILGKKIFILAPPDQVTEMEGILGKLGRGERIQHYETLRQTKDKRIINISLTISPILGPDGKVAWASSIARDITAAKKAEQALRETQLFKQAVLDSLLAHIAVIDQNGIIINVNKSWLRFAEQNGLSADRVDEGTDYLAACRKASDRNDLLARQALEGIQSVISGNLSEYTLEYPCHSPTVERWFMMKVFRPSYEFHGAVIMHLDTTERKRDEEALRQSEKKFSTFFSLVPALLVTSELSSGRIVEANETFLKAVGYSREEVIGRTTIELKVWVQPEDRKIVVEALLKEGEVRDMELEFRRKSGDVFYGLLSAKKIDMDHETYLLALVKDINERKRMEEEVKRLNNNLAVHTCELEAANRELEAFNYTVSHDLRNPLNSMIVSLKVIEEYCGNMFDEECKNYFKSINNSVFKMNELITALLNFASLTSVDLHREPVNLSELATEIAGELSGSAPDRHVNFVIAENTTANGDPNLLRMVLANLIGNAWKYTIKQPEATIEFGEKVIGGLKTYFVGDNGPGFAMSDAEKLFAPFQRLPGSEQYKGHGIGLATVERIVHRHGGSICAESVPGKGATFYFTLNH